MTRRRLRWLLPLAIAVFVMLPSGARAQTVPTPGASPCSPSTCGEPIGAPTVCANGQCFYGTTPTTKSSDYQQWTDQLMPSTAGGRLPIQDFSLGYSTAGLLGSFNLTGWFMSGLFQVASWMVSVGTWVLTWAFTFQFAGALAGAAARVAGALQTTIIGGLQLRWLCLVLAVAWCGGQMLRGRIMRGMGEFFVTLVILGLSFVVLANPAGMLKTADGAVSELSGGMMSVALGSPSASANPPIVGIPGCNQPTGCVAAGDQVYEHPEYGVAIQPMKNTITNALVEDPYDILDWGHSLTGACAKARDQILTANDPTTGAPLAPWDTQDQPREMMASAGCTAEANFNADASWSRLLGAAMLLLADSIAMVMMILIAATVIAAQFVGVGLVMVLPIALVAAIIPGLGRSMLYSWVGAAAKAILAILALTALLLFFAVSVQAVLAAFPGAPLAVPMAAFDILALVCFFLRKRFLRSGQSYGRRLGGHLASRKIGGTGRALAEGAAVGGIALGISHHLANDDQRRDIAKMVARAKKKNSAAVIQGAMTGAKAYGSVGGGLAKKAVTTAGSAAVSGGTSTAAIKVGMVATSALSTVSARAKKNSASMVASAALRLPARGARGAAETVRPVATQLAPKPRALPPAK